MDAKIINPFLGAVQNVLVQFGVKDFSKTAMQIKKEMTLDKDITAFVGIIGNVRGNVSYSFDKKTACALASAMMMGMPVEAIDEMARSALSELANMFTGNASTVLYNEAIQIDITPPTLVMGEDISCILGTVDTLMVNLKTELGVIEINFGLEM